MENSEDVQSGDLSRKENDTQLEPGGGLGLTYIEEVDDINGVVNDTISGIIILLLIF